MTSHLDGTEYPKINGVFKRYTDGPDKGRFIPGAWAQPEFALLQDVPWEWSEKIDGTNIRIIYEPNNQLGFAFSPRITIQGRTDRAQLHPDLVHAIQDMVDIRKWAETFADQPAVVYGEGYGAGIQAVGKLYRPDKSFIGFDVAVNGRILPLAAADGIMQSSLGLPVVQRYPYGLTLIEAIDIFRYGDLADHFPSDFDYDAFEGVIGRPVHGLRDQYGHRIQTKLKVVDFRP